MSVSVEAEYLTIKQAAELLDLGEPTVEQWVQAGRLPSYRMAGDQVYLRRADINQFNGLDDDHYSEGDVAAHEALRRQLAVPLNAAQRRAGLQAVEAASRTAKGLLARHGGRPFSPSSTELIRQTRDERSRHLS